MASLKLRGHTWYARIYVSNGERRTVCLHTSSKRIAREKLRLIEPSLFSMSRSHSPGLACSRCTYAARSPRHTFAIRASTRRPSVPSR